MNYVAVTPALTRAPRALTNKALAPEALHSDSLQLAVERLLRSAEGGPALAARLERYLPFLRAEFEECSTRGGLYAEVLATHPNLAPRVGRLKERQGSILEGLAALIEDLRRGSGARADAEAQRLSSRLRSLRRAEERLVIEADFRDLGGEG